MLTKQTFISLLAVASTLFVIYASLVPLRYTWQPWEEVLLRFESIPWLDLTIANRADWVANGLIMLPSGFFAMGGLFWRRWSLWRYCFAAPLVVALLWTVVIGIEFVQIYFPPRVVSQNDIFAGMVGSVVGVLLWPVLGSRLFQQFERFWACEPGPARWYLCAYAFLIAMAVYSLLPLDLILTVEEWSSKVESGRVSLLPFTDIDWGPKALVLLGLSSCRFIPAALIMTLTHGRRHAIRTGVFFAFLCEMLKLPIYSRFVSMTDAILAALCVLVAALLANPFWRIMPRLDRRLVWGAGVVGWSGIMLLAFLARFEHVIRDPIVIQERLQGFLEIPFARAHRSSEYAAGVNILVKWIAFGTLAALMMGWESRKQSTKVAYWKIVLWCGILGITIEGAQIFLEPLVSDITDWILYAIGTMLGITAFRMLIPNRDTLALQLKRFLPTLVSQPKHQNVS